jgi:tetratricopeptide (TPR) repeat protein
VAAWAAPGTAPAAPLIPGDPYEDQERSTLRERDPKSAALLERGESLLAGGQAKEADEIFRQVETASPECSIAWRRDCEALMALGQQKEALQACSKTLEREPGGAAVRALVSALVDGPAAPTPTELFQALLLTSTENRRSPGGVTVAAAACDIAERMGDVVMLRRCAEVLERVAPEDPATRRAEELLAARCPPARFWIGWFTIAAAVVLTVAHAVRRSVRRLPRRSAVSAVALVCAAIGSLPAIARADDPQGHWLSKWPVDDEHPEKSIPSEKDRNADPLQFGYWLQDVALKGEHASKTGDHLAAAKYYNVLALAVPERAIGYTKTCDEYEAAGERDKAINACAEALLHDGLLVKDYTHFVHLMLGKPGKLTEKDIGALTQVLAHMREDPGGRDFADALECEVGTRTANLAQLRECTAALAARAPNSPETISYEWALAVQEGNFTEAQGILERAKTAGVPAESLENMKRTMERQANRRYLQLALITLALVMAIGAAGVALRNARRRRDAAGGAGSGEAPPPPATASVTEEDAEHASAGGDGPAPEPSTHDGTDEHRAVG